MIKMQIKAHPLNNDPAFNFTKRPEELNMFMQVYKKDFTATVSGRILTFNHKENNKYFNICFQYLLEVEFKGTNYWLKEQDKAIKCLRQEEKTAKAYIQRFIKEFNR